MHKGQIISAEKVEELAGGPGRKKALQLRKLIEGKHKIVSELREDGALVLLTDAETLDYVVKARERHISGLFRSSRRSRTCIDVGALTGAQREEKDHTERLTHAAAKAARKASTDPIEVLLRRARPSYRSHDKSKSVPLPDMAEE